MSSAKGIINLIFVEASSWTLYIHPGPHSYKPFQITSWCITYHYFLVTPVPMLVHSSPHHGTPYQVHLHSNIHLESSMDQKYLPVDSMIAQPHSRIYLSHQSQSGWQGKTTIWVHAGYLHLFLVSHRLNDQVVLSGRWATTPAIDFISYSGIRYVW
jgi:hypothetical protein